MAALFGELQYAIRSCRRSPGFTVTVLLTIAVGVAIHTSTFAIVNAVLLRPLPVPESDRILLMSNQYPNAGVPEIDQSGSGDYYDRLREMTVFEEQALYTGIGRTLDLKGVPTKVEGLSGTPSLFRVLRVAPALGRIFTEAEGEIGNEDKIILSHGLWQELFGGDHNAIGQSVRLNGKNLEVVGVMPRNFVFASPEARFWTPLAFTAEQKQGHLNNNWVNIGRLKPGATLTLAKEQVDAVNRHFVESNPQYRDILKNAGFYTKVQLLQDSLVKDVRRVLYLLWGGALLVLFIACMNVTNLALARIALRRKELATRLAIGAGSQQLVRQIVIENVFLAGTGAILGIAGAFAILKALALYGLDQFPRAEEVAIDGRVALLSLGLALAMGVLISLLPLASVFRTNLSSVLHEDGRSGAGSLVALRTRQSLVTLQVGMACALLIGAGLLLTSFRRLLEVNPGFRTEGVITVSIDAPRTHYKEEEDLRLLARRSLDALRTMPQIDAAAIMDSVPFSKDYSNSVILAEGYQMARGESVISPRRVSVSAGYFEAMEIGLMSGRFFQESDRDKAPGVVIVDERLAKKFWPGQDPIGRRMYFPEDPNDLLKVNDKTQWMRVVGVVKTVRMEDLAGTLNSVGTYYLPIDQSVSRFLALVLRTNADPAAILAETRKAIRGIDPELALSDVKTLSARARLTLAPRRASLALAFGFGVVALFLAAIGIYGVLAYLVAQRDREIGIRMALGGTSAAILQLVLREGLILAAAGIGIGLAAAVALKDVLASEIYGVRPLDPPVIGVVISVLLMVALIAVAGPALRASRVDPARVLRG